MNMVDFEKETAEEAKENELQDKNVIESKIFSLNSGNTDEAFARLKIFDEEQALSSDINFKLDTGSQINAIRNTFLTKGLRMSS